MKYTVTITENTRGTVIVEALNEEHAKDKALESYHNGNVKWLYVEPCIDKIAKENTYER